MHLLCFVKVIKRYRKRGLGNPFSEADPASHAKCYIMINSKLWAIMEVLHCNLKAVVDRDHFDKGSHPTHFYQLS